jgi:hypothetical protein
MPMNSKQDNGVGVVISEFCYMRNILMRGCVINYKIIPIEIQCKVQY